MRGARNSMAIDLDEGGDVHVEGAAAPGWTALRMQLLLWWLLTWQHNAGVRGGGESGLERNRGKKRETGEGIGERKGEMRGCKTWR